MSGLWRCRQNPMGDLGECRDAKGTKYCGFVLSRVIVDQGLAPRLHCSLFGMCTVSAGLRLIRAKSPLSEPKMNCSVTNGHDVWCGSTL